MELILVLCLASPFFYLAIGAIVLVAIDPDGKLYEWAHSDPKDEWRATITILLWPISVYLYRFRGKDERPNWH